MGLPRNGEALQWRLERSAERFNLPRKQETTKSLYGEGYDGSMASTGVARWTGGDGDGDGERDREKHF